MRTTSSFPFAFHAILIAGALSFAPTAFAHKGHDHSPVNVGGNLATRAADTAAPVIGILSATKPSVPLAEGEGAMGIEEKQGAMIPLDLKFANQKGDSVTLRECVKGPTLFTMLYFGCTDACGLLLAGVANVLRSYADKPDKAPHVIVISIGDKEGPSDAVKAQAIANEVMQKKYPMDKWHFLTGSSEVIERVTQTAGFHFVKRGNDYDHPLCLIVLSPQGKITRYIIGTDFLPADITMSLMEANSGTVQPTIARVLRSCFSYDPKSRRLVFKTLQVSATVILTLMAGFVAFLMYQTKTRRKKGPAS
jgi:protein SCO1